MGRTLRILYLEDSETEAELVLRELRRVGFEPECTRVITESQFVAGLDGSPELILADYALPQYDGLSALSRLLELGLEIPFILISGTLGEEAAVAAIKNGAADYLMKDRLSRLGAAVERALTEQKLKEERKQAQLALRQSEACLRIVTGRARVGLVVFNREHRYVFANAAFTEIFGLPNENIAGQPIAAFLPTVYEQRIRVSLDQVFSGARVDYELRLPTPDGPFHYAVNYEPVFDGASITSVVMVAMDITALRNTEEQLRQSQKMEAIGQLAGGIAHDFNNLLTIISGYTDLLLQTHTPSDQAWELLVEIGNASDRAAELTRSLLSFSHRQIRTPENVDLNQVIVDTLKMVQRSIGEGVKVVTSLDPQLQSVWVDRSDMSQILLNLSINARDAMQGEGRLEIGTQNIDIGPRAADSTSCVEPGKYAVLTVSDSGCGMPEEVKQKIFEPFFTTKPVGKGTGLGLAMVHSIASRSGGGIEVSSSVGQGATFRIFLPQSSTVSSASRSVS